MKAHSTSIYGLMAEFDDPQSLVVATGRAHQEGYRCMDAYSPFPIEELHEALGSRHTRLPLIVLVGGLCGCLGGCAVPGKRAGEALSQLAGVHSRHLRVHDSRRSAVRGAR